MKKVNLGPNGGAHLQFADLDGDGQKEMLIRQGPGMLCSQVYARGHFAENKWIQPEDQKHFCLTAMKMSGEIMWQLAKPWDKERPYRTHDSQQMTKVLDCNGDGKLEIALIEIDELVIRDAATGKELQRTKLPYDCFANLLPAALSGDRTRPEWMLGVEDSTYEEDGWVYGNPTLVLNNDLSVRWDLRHFTGSGHHPMAIDCDGDGRDELLNGYNLIDDDGTIIWSIDITDPMLHCDSRFVDDVNEDGELEVAMAGSKDCMLARLSDGKMLWAVEVAHSQVVVGGRFRDDVKGKQLFFAERNGGAYIFDAWGRELWRGELLVIPKTVSTDLNDMPDQLLLMDLYGSFPVVMDGHGEVIGVFEDAGKRKGGNNRRGADFGEIYWLFWDDIDNDGKNEFITYDRDTVWIHKE